MSKKPSPAESFRSIQILSSKAHSLWAKAKQRMHTAHENNALESPEPPPAKARSCMTIDISAATAAKVTITVLAILFIQWVLITIRDSLFILFLSAFIAIIIDHNVQWLERKGVPRSFAIIILYLVFLSILVFLVASLIPIVASQVQEIARYINNEADAFLLSPSIHFPFIPDGANERLTFIAQDLLQGIGVKDRTSALLQFGGQLSGFAQSSIGIAASAAGTVFDFFVKLILILFLTFFIQLEREKTLRFIRSIISHRFRSYYDAKAEAVYRKVSQWTRGQLILCFSIFTLTFIALKIVGMPYALTLALLAGFTEFIPYAGPLIGAVPAVFIALAQFGIVWALVVAGIYYVIQICENNLLVPLIMKHAVGLSPIAIMFGMLVGVSFPDTIHPVIGIILAVPTTAIITIFVQDFYTMRKKK